MEIFLMAIVIQMPKLSDTMEEGVISEWFKKVGDFVDEGEPLLAIETDKATMEYASPEEGHLLEIIEKEGANVPLNQIIAVLGEKNEKYDLNELKNKSDQEHEIEEPKEANKDNDLLKHKEVAQAQASSQSRLRASPLAKKIAADRGIDLANIEGSGPNGRILQRDLSTTGESAKQVIHSNISKGDISSPLETKKIPHTMMRKTIAKRLLAGKNEAPHFYLTVSASMDAMIKWRQNLNSESSGMLDTNQKKISLNDLIILSAAKALEKHPQVNSSWHDDYIMQHGNIDISMAVALPTGLITPIIHDANLLGIRGISKRSKELAQKAKDGKLQPEDYTGGTFTVSNLGMTSVESFTAIINPPQACILAIGTTKLVPHVNEHGQIIAQNRMKLTMSCDHRVVDGMIGAKYLETLISYLENPLMMFS